MTDEVRKRLEDRPEIHILLGRRADSDDNQSVWQPRSWPDRLKTTGRSQPRFHSSTRATVFRVS